MWLFRRNPQGLTAQERNLLETLFKRVQQLILQAFFRRFEEKAAFS
jgi:hypothetical protein